MIEDSFFSEPRQTHDFCGAMGGVGGARRAEERRGKGERGARPLPLVGVQGAGEGGAALRSNTGGSAGLGGGEEGGGGLVRGESKSPSSVFSASPPITPAPLAEFLSPRTRGRKNSSSSDGLEAAAAAAAAAVAAARGGGRKSEQGGGASSLWKLPQLRFESRFECGNLARAGRGGDGEYDLLVSSDLNTDGNTQWFYFAVTGMVEAVEDGEDGGAGGGIPRSTDSTSLTMKRGTPCLITECSRCSIPRRWRGGTASGGCASATTFATTRTTLPRCGSGRRRTLRSSVTRHRGRSPPKTPATAGTSLSVFYQSSVYVDLDWISTYMYSSTNGICLFYRCFSGVFHTGLHTCSRPVLVLNNLHTYVYVETHTTSPLSSTGTGPTVTRIPTHTCSGCSGRSRASRTSTTGHVYWQGRSFVRPWPVTP